MSYRFSGHFIESCDCTVICPCWVDDDPVGGHCTGFIAWQIDQGGIAVVDGTRVDGCKVVSVATHAGNRRDGDNTTTMQQPREEIAYLGPMASYTHQV